MVEVVLADADAIIDYFNDCKPMADVVEHLIKEDALGISAISVFELYAGISGKKRLKAIEAIIKTSIILPVDATSAHRAAGIYTLLKKRGDLIGNQDLLIAGIALANDLPLLTRNIRHFQKIKGLRILHPSQILKEISNSSPLRDTEYH